MIVVAYFAPFLFYLCLYVSVVTRTGLHIRGSSTQDRQVGQFPARKWREALQHAAVIHNDSHRKWENKTGWWRSRCTTIVWYVMRCISDFFAQAQKARPSSPQASVSTK